MGGIKEGEFTLTEKIEISSGLINAIIAGYQIALNKTLGSGAAAMTQLLIKNIGDFLEEMLEGEGFEIHAIEDLKKDLPEAFKRLGISDKVKVELPGNGSTSGDKYLVKIYDSIFKPAARLLAKKGIKFTLSPESFLAAAIIRKAVRKVRPGAQVKIKMYPQENPEEPLVLEVIIR